MKVHADLVVCLLPIPSTNAIWSGGKDQNICIWRPKEKPKKVSFSSPYLLSADLCTSQIVYNFDRTSRRGTCHVCFSGYGGMFRFDARTFLSQHPIGFCPIPILTRHSYTGCLSQGEVIKQMTLGVEVSCLAVENQTLWAGATNGKMLQFNLEVRCRSARKSIFLPHCAMGR